MTEVEPGSACWRPGDVGSCRQIIYPSGFMPAMGLVKAFVFSNAGAGRVPLKVLANDSSISSILE